MKKMLVPFDEKKPLTRSNDFIYPEITSSGVGFAGIKKSKRCQQGLVVYTGTEITADEILLALKAAGKSISDVQLTKLVREYVQQLSVFSIGNIIGIEPDDELGFKLKKIKDRAGLMGTSNIP